MTQKGASFDLKWMRELKSDGIVETWTSILDNLVQQAEGERDSCRHHVHLTLNLEAIEGLKGVSTNCLSGGIPTEDAVQICYETGFKLGRASILTSVDISEFNPFVEDQQTGRFAATLFYYVTLGLAKGLQERSL